MTFSVKPSIYLDTLVRDFLLFGGRLVIRTFDTPRNLMTLSEPLIVNCTGLVSRDLFGDAELVPVKGQLTHLVPQPEVNVTGGRTIFSIPCRIRLFDPWLSKGIIVRSIVRYLFVLALCCVLSACTSASVPDAGSAADSLGITGGVPETEDQKILNALGQALAQNLVGAGFSAEEFVFVQRGLSDTVLGQDALVELNEYGSQIQAFMQQRTAGGAEGELVLAIAFMEEQAGVEGAERTESGIVIQEITPGTGANPTAEDTVQVHYHGTLRDGTVFDSSVDRGEPATFPLTGVIPCWTEGLQHISVGGKSRLVCPPNLAYGPQGRPGIPGNAALVFEVELLDIVQN